jgi:hypothetical protein
MGLGALDLNLTPQTPSLLLAGARKVSVCACTRAAMYACVCMCVYMYVHIYIIPQRLHGCW